MRNYPKRSFMLFLTVAFVSLAIDNVRADNWPGWRGDIGSGISQETEFPVKWSRNENVRWRVDLPEPGNSTPIVWDDRVFVTQPMQAGRRRTVICFDRKTGDQIWQSGVDAVEMEPTHNTNPYCSPSPVTDGEHVIAWFGSVGLVAFDMDGNLKWNRPLGKAQHVFGYGGSPLIHEDLCFLNFGPGVRELAVAVDKRTGEVVWQHELPGASQADNTNGKDIYGTWSSPILIEDAGRPAVVFCMRNAVKAYEAKTGKEIWACYGLGPQMKSTPVAGEGVIVAFGGKDSATLAIRLGGKGDVTGSHVLWKIDQAKSRLGAGVIHDGYVYANRSNGVMDCIELQSGRVAWEERVSGATWSSLFLAGGKIYALDQSGDTYVLAASPEYQQLAKNSLGEHTNSTVVGSQGNLLIRTHDALWCIGK